MTEAIIMAFIGDLFPRRIAEPEVVASGISHHSASMDLRCRTFVERDRLAPEGREPLDRGVETRRGRGESGAAQGFVKTRRGFAEEHPPKGAKFDILMA